MKRTGIIFFIALILISIVTSCMKINETNAPSREEEQINLNNYINKLITDGNDVDTTEMGIYHITFDEGTGDYPKNGDTLTVGYAGYFSNGYLFDTSAWHNTTDSTFTFVLGNPPMIAGWDDGMKVINKNARVQLIMSSDFAYGGSGAGIIPPYQTLVFIVIMKNIKPSN